MYILCDLFRKYADVDMIIILGNAPLKGEGGGEVLPMTAYMGRLYLIPPRQGTP